MILTMTALAPTSNKQRQSNNNNSNPSFRNNQTHPLTNSNNNPQLQHFRYYLTQSLPSH